MPASHDKVTCQIVQHFGIIATDSGGWTREFNLVSWNGREAKYDIRSWSPDKKKMGRGITMTGVECDTLRTLLNSRFPRISAASQTESRTDVSQQCP